MESDSVRSSSSLSVSAILSMIADRVLAPFHAPRRTWGHGRPYLATGHHRDGRLAPWRVRKDVRRRTANPCAVEVFTTATPRLLKQLFGLMYQSENGLPSDDAVLNGAAYGDCELECEFDTGADGARQRLAHAAESGCFAAAGTEGSRVSG